MTAVLSAGLGTLWSSQCSELRKGFAHSWNSGLPQKRVAAEHVKRKIDVQHYLVNLEMQFQWEEALCILDVKWR